MDAGQREIMRDVLRERFQALTREISGLEQSDRKDEANLEKAARNIYTQCAALLDTAGDSVAYAAQLDEWSAAWRQAREMAELHGDYDRVATEEVKLAAIAEARALWEESTKEENR